MKQILRKILCGAVLLSSMTLSSSAFSDVEEGTWYYPYVTDMVSGGFVAGQSSQVYGVGQSLNLAEFATMLSNAFYGDTLVELKAESWGNWWEPYVMACYERGGMSLTLGGQSYSTLGTWGDYPSTALTRYDMASMVSSLLTERGVFPLTDAQVQEICGELKDEIADYYKRDVATAYHYGFVGGRSNGNFDGSSTLNRSEAAVVLSALVHSDLVSLEQAEVTGSSLSQGTGSSGVFTNTSSSSDTLGDSSNLVTGNGGSLADLHPFVVETFELINEQRELYGLSKLTLDTTLCALAQYKSDEMQELDYLDHTSPTYGAFSNILSNNGIYVEKARENLAQGQRSPAEVVEAWMNSVDHKTNILAMDIGKIGIGFTEEEYYWSQLFTNSSAYTGGELSDDLGGSTGVGGMTSGDYSYAMEIPYYQYDNYFNVGYMPVDSLIEIPVDNTGDYPLVFQSLVLTGTDRSSFKGYVSASSIPVGGRAYLIIEPVEGLSVGEYKFQVEFSVDHLPGMSQSLTVYVAEPVTVPLPDLEPAPEFEIPDGYYEDVWDKEPLGENLYEMSFYGEDMEDLSLVSSSQSLWFYEDTGETRVLFTLSEALPEGVVLSKVSVNHFDATVESFHLQGDKTSFYVTFQDLPYSEQIVEVDLTFSEGYLLVQRPSPISMTILLNGEPINAELSSPFVLDYKDKVEVIIPEAYTADYQPQMFDSQGELLYRDESSAYGNRSTGIFVVDDYDMYISIGEKS